MEIGVIERAEAAHPLLVKLCERLPPPFGGELRRMCGEEGRAEELRFRRERPIALRLGGVWRYGRAPMSGRLLEDLLDDFCEGALYAHRESIADGYVTLRDGCRVGVCGRAVLEEGRVVSVCDVRSLCIRLPAALPSGAVLAAEELVPLIAPAAGTGGSMLLFAPPGAGKTTLLRALAQCLSRPPAARQVAVVDSRCELTPLLSRSGGTIDLLTGYPRGQGIEIALRTLGADVILCDEIGRTSDAEAILNAQACGVPIVATAHGDTLDALRNRPALSALFSARVFAYGVGVQRVPGCGTCMLQVTAL